LVSVGNDVDGGFFSSEFIFSKLRVRDDDNESLFGEGTELVAVVVVEDNGGGKRKDDVAMGLIFEGSFCCCCLGFGDIGGFRRVA
jgi:hypothetical protein